MKRWILAVSLAAFTLAATAFAVLTLAATAFAADGHVKIEEPWARATLPGQNVGAVWLTMKATNTTGDHLISASSPVALRVELHTHTFENNVMRMREIPRIDLPPNVSVVLEPGGLHLMLFGLRAPLVQGTTIPLSLVFEKAGRIDVSVTVIPLGGSHHKN